MDELEREEFILQYRKTKEPKLDTFDKLLDGASYTLSCHNDPDGIFSGVLLSHVYKPTTVRVPNEFGNIDEDVMVFTDQVPKNPSLSAIGLDHHPQHWDRDFSYSLVWRTYPTSRIVWELFKEKIDKQLWWKTIAGLVGEASVYYTPYEIIDASWTYFPEIWQDWVSYYPQTYGYGIKAYRTPVYKLLSSGINSACKYITKIPVPGQPGAKQPLSFGFSAFEEAYKATRPMDLLRSDRLETAKEGMRNSAKEAMDEKKRPANLISIDLGPISVYEIDRDEILSGRIASMIQGEVQKSVIVVNARDGSISLRGDFSGYFSSRLKEKGYEMGGHAVAGGGGLKEGQTVDGLIEALRKIIGGR